MIPWSGTRPTLSLKGCVRHLCPGMRRPDPGLPVDEGNRVPSAARAPGVQERSIGPRSTWSNTSGLVAEPVENLHARSGARHVRGQVQRQTYSGIRFAAGLR